jgi:hypothetical protein
VNDTLKTELIEVFSKQIDASVRSTFDSLVKVFGPSMKGIYNSRQAAVWSETVRPCCATKGDRYGSEYAVDEQLLASFKAKVASVMADDVLAKVSAKVGELENSKVIRVRGAEFHLHGIKNGQKVYIEQTQILNVSSKGKLFNQFPSRIYVDGKFTPAAKFAKI